MNKDDERLMIENLRKLRDEVDGTIPDEIVHFGLYKVRTNWFNGVQSRLGRMLKKGLIPESLREEVLLFIDSVMGKGERLTTQDDIDKADALITKVLGDGKNE